MNKQSSGFLGMSILLLASTASVTACGSDSPSPAGEQGGASTTGGQSSVSTGGAGSGSLVAAMSLNFQSGGTNCPITVGYDDFPAVSGGHPVTASGATATTPDNVTSPRGAVRVQCGVNSALLHGSISLGGGAVSMAFNVSRTGTSTGNLVYVPLDSSVSYGGTSAVPCTITAITTTATGGLFSVSCPTFAGDDGVTSCVLGQSYVYFEGCTKS